MIWYFLAGMIAGAVGTVMFIRWYAERNAIRLNVTSEELEKELKKLEEKPKDE